jgi:hypothetical protein
MEGVSHDRSSQGMQPVTHKRKNNASRSHDFSYFPRSCSVFCSATFLNVCQKESHFLITRIDLLPVSLFVWCFPLGRDVSTLCCMRGCVRIVPSKFWTSWIFMTSWHWRLFRLLSVQFSVINNINMATVQNSEKEEILASPLKVGNI